MAGPPDPGRKPKAPKPPEPLPRLWRIEPSPDDDGDAADRPKKKRAAGAGTGDDAAARPKKKKSTESDDAPDKTSKIEETPKFDTYETRQRVRWIIGSVMASIFLILLVIGIRRVRVADPEAVVNNAPDPRVKLAAEAKARVEQEAHSLLGNAQSAARNGRIPAAIDLFNKVAKNYPNTDAAREAMESLARHRKKLPLLAEAPGAGAAPVTLTPDTNATSTAPATVAMAPAAPEPAPVIVPPRPPAIVAPPRPVKVLPAGFKEKPDTKFHESGWPMEIVGGRDGAEMVFVPGGTFTMGRNDGDPPERPAHQVKLASYYIDRHEVTVRQYQQFLKEAGQVDELDRPTSKAKEKEKDKESSEPSASSEDHPAVNVSARNANAYCVWAGKKLPTEAQWEMAARGQDGRIYPWGNGPPNWAPPRVPKQIDPVMSQPSDVSPYWAFDMAGNAWEWTGDYYDSRYFLQFRDTVAKDPVGPPLGRSRPIMLTVKGGSKDWKVFWREGMRIEQRHPYLGFRGVLQAEKPEPPAPKASGPSPNQNGMPVDPGPTGGVVPF
ncbi:SUMF1/EgtB/PvdO family nonheme iron enzyme [Tundrisphaera sp. TA3]|uniref:SUMF1/EgtB/PvdO family nonheme iron enzyme n=1 Tax=Tundrisphaera sp. TA3 TaxID=3435775 RepID=UPI003EBAB0E7